MSQTQGIHHLGLTVPNVQAASLFFVEALGFNQIKEVPAYPAIFVSDGTVMLTLWQAEDPSAATLFNRRDNIGLHHFALKLTAGVDIEALHLRLAERDDVQIEFAPEALGESGLKHMMCGIPGNIRLELITA